MQRDIQRRGRREVRGLLDGGTISSDTGGLLLHELELRRRILEQFATCCEDHRDPAKIEHSAADVILQRVYGLCLSYEDLNDHDECRRLGLVRAFL